MLFAALYIAQHALAAPLVLHTNDDPGADPHELARTRARTRTPSPSLKPRLLLLPPPLFFFSCVLPLLVLW